MQPNMGALDVKKEEEAFRILSSNFALKRSTTKELHTHPHAHKIMDVANLLNARALLKKTCQMYLA